MDRYVTDIKNGCYQNPVLPMDFSDPDAIRVGEDYYLISSSFTYLPGVPVLHSKDLVHWERIVNCVERLPFDRYAQPAHGCGTWAPALRYHAGRFYAFIPLPDEGIFYTEATDPAGPWSALHCVKSASGWIDPCPLWDDDGSVYMAHAFAKSRCGIKHKIQLSRLDPETLEVVEDGPIVFDGTLSQPTAEGPKMYKRNGWYYIFIPAGGVEYGWQTVLRARNVYGPYEEKIVMHQGASSINGPHQGAWVTAPDGSDWFLHFQDRFELGRVVHLQPMCWHSDWPFIGLEQNGDGIGEPVTEWDCPKGEAGPGLQIGDSFTNGKPGLQWQWQANPQPEAWLRPVAGDALHLVCGASGSLWRQPNVLSQMLPAADFTANVTLGLAGCGAGAKVGLSVMGQKYSAIELCRTAQGCTVRLVQGMVKDLAPTGDAEETILVTDEAEREKLQSSKYVQSDPKDSYTKVKQRLSEGKRVLFTGTPCQIAGLYAFLGGNPENLYTVDLICHGVPSPKFFKKYLEYQNKQTAGRVIYFNFRSKDKRGWGTQYLLKTKTKTKTKTLSLDRYGKHFMDGDCYRESCYQCAYANTSRVGDLTVGDFWGIAKSHPCFNSPKGVSSVFVNTEKGQKLFEMMRVLAEVEEATLEEGMVKQHNLVQPSNRPVTRDTFYKSIDEPGFIENIKVGFQPKARLKSVLPNKLIQKIKSL